jgi:ATP-dependent Clp protease adaptor protein ClpS
MMSDDSRSKPQIEDDGELAVEEEIRYDEPRKYAVIVHNDDYTTMEFVVYILQHYFYKTEEEAVQVMMKVHKAGKGLAGIFSFEIAETKVSQVSEKARSEDYPLKCTLEPVD